MVAKDHGPLFSHSSTFEMHVDSPPNQAYIESYMTGENPRHLRLVPPLAELETPVANPEEVAAYKDHFTNLIPEANQLEAIQTSNVRVIFHIVIDQDSTVNIASLQAAILENLHGRAPWVRMMDDSVLITAFAVSAPGYKAADSGFKFANELLELLNQPASDLIEFEVDEVDVDGILKAEGIRSDFEPDDIA